jgi:hypothetical protein
MKKLVPAGILTLVFMLTFSFTVTFADASVATKMHETIVKAAAKLSKVEIATKNFTLAPGKAMQLKLKKTPTNAALLTKTEWNSTFPSIASVDKNGKVTAKKGGVTLITFRTWSKNNQSDIKYTSSFCYVSKSAPKAKALTASDIQFTVNKTKIDSTFTLSKAKNQFKKANIMSDMGMTYFYHDKIMLAFFTKSGKLYAGNVDSAYSDAEANTPRGIKNGSKVVDVIAKYGYPSWVEEEEKDAYGEGLMLGYEFKGNSLVFSIDTWGNGSTISAIGIYSKNNK